MDIQEVRCYEMCKFRGLVVDVQFDGPVSLILKAHLRQKLKKTRRCQLCSRVGKKEDIQFGNNSVNPLLMLCQGGVRSLIV